MVKFYTFLFAIKYIFKIEFLLFRSFVLSFILFIYKDSSFGNSTLPRRTPGETDTSIKPRVVSINRTHARKIEPKDMEDLIHLQGPLTEDAVMKALQARFNVGKYFVSIKSFSILYENLTIINNQNIIKMVNNRLDIVSKTIKKSERVKYTSEEVSKSECFCINEMTAVYYFNY